MCLSVCMSYVRIHYYERTSNVSINRVEMCQCKCILSPGLTAPLAWCETLDSRPAHHSTAAGMYLHFYSVGNSECKIQIISYICRPAFFWIHVVSLLRYVNEMECSTAPVARVLYITPFGQVNNVKTLIVIGGCAHWFSREASNTEVSVKRLQV